MKRNRGIAIAIVLFAAAVVLAIFGANFTLRQVLVGGVAFVVWEWAAAFWKAAFEKPDSFQRLQFRITLDVGRILHDAGLYPNDLREIIDQIRKDTPGKGSIIFTWLEPRLYFLNTLNLYSSTLLFSLDLPMIGSRKPESMRSLADMIEMRMSADGYAIVFVTREERYSNGKQNGFVLLSLPYSFFQAFQGEGEPWDRSKRAHTVLERVEGLRYHEWGGRSSAWDYQGKYASLRWWDV